MDKLRAEHFYEAELYKFVSLFMEYLSRKLSIDTTNNEALINWRKKTMVDIQQGLKIQTHENKIITAVKVYEIKNGPSEFQFKILPATTIKVKRIGLTGLPVEYMPEIEAHINSFMTGLKYFYTNVFAVRTKFTENMGLLANIVDFEKCQLSPLKHILTPSFDHYTTGFYIDTRSTIKVFPSLSY